MNDEICTCVGAYRVEDGRCTVCKKLRIETEIDYSMQTAAVLSYATAATFVSFEPDVQQLRVSQAELERYRRSIIQQPKKKKKAVNQTKARIQNLDWEEE
jgi:hypothetical protein